MRMYRTGSRASQQLYLIVNKTVLDCTKDEPVPVNKTKDRYSLIQCAIHMANDADTISQNKNIFFRKLIGTIRSN